MKNLIFLALMAFDTKGVRKLLFTTTTQIQNVHET